MDRLKAQINVSGSATNASASIETVEANLPGALRLAAEILREPAFPDSEFETVRQQRIAAAEASRSDPQALAVTEFQHRMNPYPRGDAALRAPPPTSRSKISRRSPSTTSANSTSISMAPASAKSPFPDSSTPPEISKLATELFGNWKSPGAYTRILPTCTRRSIRPTRRSRPPTSRTPFFIAGEHRQDERRRPRLSGTRDGQLHVRRQPHSVRAFRAASAIRKASATASASQFGAPTEGRWRQLPGLRHQHSAEHPQSGSQLPR